MYKCVFSIFLKLPFCSYVNAWDNVSGSLKPAFECFRPDNGFFPALFYLMFFNIRLYHASFLSTTPLSGLSFPLLPHPLTHFHPPSTARHLLGAARSLGAVILGYQGVRTFCPQPVAKCLEHVGGPSTLLGLVAMATDVEGLYAAVKALVCACRSNKVQ